MTGLALLKLAVKHLGERYVLGVLVPKNNRNWKGPWDCAEFVSWCVYQLIKRLYGCVDDEVPAGVADAYTGAWARDARTLGKKVSIKEATNTPGAALLRVGPKIGHIVISDGKGGTVEAHSSLSGVIRSQVTGRRWDMGILVPGITYRKEGEFDPASPKHIFRLMDPYMKDPFIKLIQARLLEKGFKTGGTDGVFGELTQLALRKFQAFYGLVVDGEFGNQSAEALGLLSEYMAL